MWDEIFIFINFKRATQLDSYMSYRLIVHVLRERERERVPIDLTKFDSNVHLFPLLSNNYISSIY